jgi:hypothetical protein
MPPFRLADVNRVEFYKRDEVTTDLVCCEVSTATERYFAHEEAPDWQNLVDYVAQLPGFDRDWYAKVSQPAFAECRTLAFSRA